MTQKAGIKDIAKLAGVSTATVSRTLRNPELVSSKTKEKVMKAVNESNYRPNQMGINLRTKRSGNIVAIIPDITNLFNAGLIRAIELEAQSRGYSVLLGDTQGDNDRVKSYAHMVDSRQADGIILCSHIMPFDVDENNVAINIPPLVNANENTEVDGIHKIMIDNKDGAMQVMTHLLALGHKRIACIKGPNDTSSSNERLVGYKEALTNAGIPIDEQLIQTGNYKIESGMSATQQLLQLKERPTAIFCFNDEMAIGSISLLKDIGYKIPLDISIVGFDDIRFSKYISPSLTTVQQPVELIGKAAVNTVIDLINNKVPKNELLILPVKLIERGSTAKVNDSVSSKQ